MTAEAHHDGELIETWTLPPAARLGSSVRSQGLYLQICSHLPKAVRKAFSVKAGELTLRMPRDAADEFAEAASAIGKALEGIEARPVIPRELEDILGISATERRRWLADGRLLSSGTRTVHLRGRATITFHVFDPVMVEDILDRGAVDAWREYDAEKAAENRRRAVWKSKLARTSPSAGSPRSNAAANEHRIRLQGWAEFERNGPVR